MIEIKALLGLINKELKNIIYKDLQCNLLQTIVLSIIKLIYISGHFDYITSCVHWSTLSSLVDPFCGFEGRHWGNFCPVLLETKIGLGEASWLPNGVVALTLYGVVCCCAGVILLLVLIGIMPDVMGFLTTVGVV